MTLHSRRRPKLYFHTNTVLFDCIALICLVLCANLAACRQRVRETRRTSSPDFRSLGSPNVAAMPAIRDGSTDADSTPDGSVPSRPQSKSMTPKGAEVSPQTPEPSVRFLGKAGRRAIKGKSGLVVSVEPRATRVGVDILESGGNAVDAAVGVALALAVTHPSAGNLGGGGFWLIHRKDEPTAAVDFRETAPAALNRERFLGMIRAGGEGADSVGVPGTVAGLFEAHRRFGKLPWRQVTLGAIRLAQAGHRVGIAEAHALKKAWPSLKQCARAREVFAIADGRPPRAGVWVKRPTLGHTLEQIRDLGPDGFYRGDVAASIIRALGETSQITAADLVEYRARWRSPRQFTYRGLLIETMPLPSAGGVALTEALKMLERFDVDKMPRNSASYVHLILEIQRRADYDRVSLATDPDRLNSDQVRSLESRFLDSHAWDSSPIDLGKATPNLGVPAALGVVESANTTHFSVVNRDQMIVSATMTLSAAFGAKIVTDTGITLNNTLASFAETGLNQPHPGQRTTSSMAPTLVFDVNGPVLVLGTPGGDAISSTLLEVLSNLVNFKMPLDEAVDAPRVHQSFATDRARYETSRPLSRTVRKQLQKMGHIWDSGSGKQGHANCILLIQSAAAGYADPREGGLALAARDPAKSSR